MAYIRTCARPHQNLYFCYEYYVTEQKGQLWERMPRFGYRICPVVPFRLGSPIVIQESKRM